MALKRRLLSNEIFETSYSTVRNPRSLRRRTKAGKIKLQSALNLSSQGDGAILGTEDREAIARPEPTQFNPSKPNPKQESPA